MRFFVDALMQIGDLTDNDRNAIEAQVAASGQAKSVETVLTEASGLLSGLYPRRPGVVLTAKSNVQLEHVEFVPARARARAGGAGRRRRSGREPRAQYSGRVADLALTEASNFLNAHIRGKTLADARGGLKRALVARQAEIDELTQRLVADGLASWSGGERDERKLIVRGQAHLLEDLHALADLERVRLLFDDLETRREVIDLLGRAERAEGVRIFIGSENKLFSLSGSSTIVAPYHDAAGRIVGVLGVIRPTRLNYARVIPMVDYTAKVVSKLLGGSRVGHKRLIFPARTLISGAVFGAA